MIIGNIVAFLKVKSYRALTISTLSVLGTGTVFFHFVEKWGWFDSFYFSVITLTTVGYGDFSPQTVPGKAFVIVYILTGIGIILGLINAIYEHRVNQFRERQEKKKNRSAHKTKTNKTMKFVPKTYFAFLLCLVGLNSFAQPNSVDYN